MADVGRPRRVFLHIGAPKTGTTYLQAVFAKNRAALAGHGIAYPASQVDAHHKPVWDLRDVPEQRQGTPGVRGSWQQLVDEANGSDLDVLISSEHLVFATRSQVATALSAFDGEVHVVYTARDLVRQVPAVWQERIKNQKVVTYRFYVQSIMAGTGGPAKQFWQAQDAAAVLDRWSVPSPGRTHVVTAPPAGASQRLLWDRFASVLGLDGTRFDIDIPQSANPSLGMMQTELLRRYNERVGKDLPWPAYRRLIRTQLDALRAVRADRKVGLTGAEHAFFVERARRIGATLSSKGYDIVGDLDELIPAAASGGASSDELAGVTDAEVLDAALDVMHELLQRRGPRSGKREGTSGGA